jgi:hypothetical protein
MTALVVPAGGTEGQRLIDFHRIIVADKPKAVQRAAAEELAHYLGHIVGRKIDIVPLGKHLPSAPGRSIFVGDEVTVKLLGLSQEPWKEEEWLLRSVPQGLAVAGDDGVGDPWSAATRAGSMLAAYTLLDDYLGVRWFWPGPFGEHIPHDPQAVIPPLNLRSTPTLFIRSVQLGYSSYHTKVFYDEGKRWFRRSRLGWTRSAVFGHSWDNTFHLKSGEDFRAHPEWFALVQGVRRPPQMCTTHPEVLDRVVARVLASKLDIVNISPSDGGGFCECNEETKSTTHKRLGIPSCTSLDVPGVLAYDNKTTQLSDRMFTYANEIARRVRQRDPHKGVGMFAYTYYNRPPLRIKALEPNLYLSFVYQSAAMRNPEELAQWHRSVAGWQKLGARMVVREGWGNHYLLDLPLLHYQQILDNLAEAHRLGFVAGYGEGSKCFATQAPNFWALTRMLWDPRRDTSRVMDDFYRSAYGPAAAEMRAFFDTYQHALDRNWRKQRRLVDTSQIAYANLINSWHLLLPASVVQEAETHLAAAAKQVAPGEYADRVAFHRFGQDYTRTMLELLDHYRQLADTGLKLDSFRPAVKPLREDTALRAHLLRRAYELGELREKMLLAHRDWAAMDEGLYAFANDAGLRQWHARVKQALGIRQTSSFPVTRGGRGK